MRILIAAAIDPHENYDEKRLCDAVSKWYRGKGHSTDICFLPFKMDFHGIHEQILAYRLLTTYPEAEMLITIGYPAFALQHPNKHVMLLNFLPEFHGNYNTEYGYMEQWYRVQKDQRLRQNLLNAENICLHEARSIHCASSFLTNEVASLGCEVGEFQTISALPDIGANETNREEILVQSCLAPIDRLDLLLEALRNTDVKIRLFIPSAEDCYIDAVKTRIARFSLSERVQITRSVIGTNDIKKCKGIICLRRCSGYIPSWVSVAVGAQIPTIIPTDGGALCEVNGDETAVVVEPKAEEIAEVISRIKTRKGIQTIAEQKLPSDTALLLESWEE